MGRRSRSMAFRIIPVFLLGTLVGSALPEFGNILAGKLGLWSHEFNSAFLAVGVVGVMLALYLGYKDGR